MATIKDFFPAPTTLAQDTHAEELTFTADIEQEKKLTLATKMDKAQAFVNTVGEATSVEEAYKFVKHPFQDKSMLDVDDEWKTMTSDNSFVDEIATNYGGQGDVDFRDAIRDSDNEKVARQIGTDYMKDKSFKELVDNTIGETTQLAANITGSVFDIDVVATGSLGLLRKVGKMRDVIGSRALVGTEAGLYHFSVEARMSEDIHYTSDDRGVDHLIGSALFVPLFMIASKSDAAKKLGQLRTDSVTDKNQLDEIAEEEGEILYLPAPKMKALPGSQQTGFPTIITEVGKKEIIEQPEVFLLPPPDPKMLPPSRQTGMPTIEIEVNVDREVFNAVESLSKSETKGKAYDTLNSKKKAIDEDIRAKEADGTFTSKTIDTLKNRSNRIKQVLESHVRKVLDNQRDFKVKSMSSAHNLSEVDVETISKTAKHTARKVEELEFKFESLDNRKTFSKETVVELEEMINNIIVGHGGKSVSGIIEKGTKKLSKNHKISIDKNADDTYSVMYNGKKMSTLQKGIALSIIAASTSQASAGDDDSIPIAGVLLGGIALWFGGASLMKTIKNNEGKTVVDALGDMASGMIKKEKSSKNLAEARSWSDIVDNLTQKMRLGFTETWTSIAKHGEDARILITDLVQNIDNGIHDNVAAIQEHIIRSYGNGFTDSQAIHYREFVKLQEASYADRLISSVYHDGVKYDMNRMASDILLGVEIKNLAPEAMAVVKAFALDQRKLYDELFDEMKAAGMKVVKTDNYMPRLVDTDAISLLNNMDEASLIAMKKNVADMIYAKQTTKNIAKATQQAEQYINGLSKETSSFLSSSDEIILGLVDELRRSGKEGAEVEEAIEDLLSRLGDKANRTKTRIDMDLTKFNNFTAHVDGNPIEVSVDKLFDMDSQSVFNRYINSMSGHIALAKKDYKSVAALDDAIAKIKSPEARSKLEKVKKQILGENLVDPWDSTTQLVTAAKNMSIGVLLPLVAVSLLPEIFKTAFRTSTNASMMAQQLKEFTNFMAKDSKSELSNQMSSYFGYGNQRYNMSTSFKGFSDIANAESMMSSSLVNKSAAFRNMVLNVSQLIRTNDWMHRMNMIGNADTLAKWLNGNKKLTEFELKKFGITEKTKELLDGKLNLTSLNNLEKIDMKGWTQAQHQEFTRVLTNMEQRYVQDAAMGASAMWTKDSAFGMFMGTLLNFPMQAYANHGLFDARGTATLDKDAAMSNVMWFTGNYAAVQASAAIHGRDLTDEDAIMAAASRMPLNVVSPLYQLSTNGSAITATSKRLSDTLLSIGE